MVEPMTEEEMHRYLEFRERRKGEKRKRTLAERFPVEDAEPPFPHDAE